MKWRGKKLAQWSVRSGSGRANYKITQISVRSLNLLESFLGFFIFSGGSGTRVEKEALKSIKEGRKWEEGERDETQIQIGLLPWQIPKAFCTSQ